MRNLAARLMIFAMLATGVSILTPASAEAIKGWDAGRIVDDSVFTDKGSMSISQIQTFLNSKVSNCDTNGQQLSEFGGPDLNGDGKVQRWEWGKSKYNQTTFPCLKDYTQDGKKAAQIIYDAAQKYSISPKVLIVLLQKEQTLVTDTWPLNVQYRSATGYGCPDTAACDSQYYGLANQINWAATMFRAIMNDSPSWYTPYELGDNYIQYNPVSSCGGTNVNIKNRSTQALYNYTPYQPNKGALDAGWGSSQCGAYGNRNFFLYFSNWFGQPNASARYDYSLVSRELFSDSAYTNKIGSNTSTVAPGTTVYAQVTVQNTGNQVWYEEFMRLGTQDPRDRQSSMATQEWINARRPSGMLQSSVAAGGTATFRFPIKTPATIGYYVERFGALLEGQRWLDDTFAFGITTESTEPYHSMQSSDVRLFHDDKHQYPITSSPKIYTGSKIYAKISLKNTGNTSWPAGTTRIGTTTPQDRSSLFQDITWHSSRRAGSLESVVEPGQTGTFMFSMTAPSTSGSYLENFGLVIDGVAWVSQDVASIPLEVNSRPDNTLHKGQSLLNTGRIVSANDIYQLSLQSDGNIVLRAYTGKALWNTKTNGRNGSRLTMQNDGNLVLYTSTGKALWNTETNGDF